MHAIGDWLETGPALTQTPKDTAIIARLLVGHALAHGPWSPLEQRLISRGLASLAGLNACLASEQTADSCHLLQCIVDTPELSFGRVLELTISAHDSACQGADHAQARATESSLAWQQYVSMLPGGRLTAYCASFELRRSQVLDSREPVRHWLADARQTVARLLRQVMQSLEDQAVLQESQCRAIATYLLRLTTLHNIDTFFTSLVDGFRQRPRAARQVWELLLVDERHTARHTHALMVCLSAHADRVLGQEVISELMGHCSRRTDVAGTVLNSKLELDLILRRQLFRILCRDSVDVRITLSAAASIWSNAAFVRLASVQQQESATQNILLLSGMADTVHLLELVKGQEIMDGVSRRLDATNPTVREMGMMLVDALMLAAAEHSPDHKRIFASASNDAGRLSRYRAIFKGDVELEPLEGGSATCEVTPSPTAAEAVDDHQSTRAAMRSIVPGRYDSDDEDSEDDPTLIVRDRPTRPVYIRDLISMLLRHDSFDHVRIALEQAPKLLAAKAKPTTSRVDPSCRGTESRVTHTEISDWALKLVDVLIGMRDNFDIDAFEEKRSAALLALIRACPEKVGPSLAHSAFSSDLGLSQRVGLIAILARAVQPPDSVDDADSGTSVFGTLPTATMRQFSDDLIHQLARPSDTLPVPDTSGPGALRYLTLREVEDWLLNPLLSAFARFWQASGSLTERADQFYTSSVLCYATSSMATLFEAACPGIRTQTLRDVAGLLIATAATRSINTEVLGAQLVCLNALLTHSTERVLLDDLGEEIQQLAEWCLTHVVPQVNQSGGRLNALTSQCLSRLEHLEEARRELILEGGVERMKLNAGRFGLAGLR